MPTPLLRPGHERWPEVERAWELRQQGLVARDIAATLGVPQGTVEHWLQIYPKRRDDPAIAEAKQAVGTNLSPVLAWAKTKSEDGTSYSVLLKPDPIADDTLDRIREAFEGMTPAEPVAAPTAVNSDLCTVIPIADRHNGLRAWGRETGEDYDHKIAARRLREWVGRCVDASPASDTAIILDVGDGEHMDDATNATPKSKHVLDVDTRVFLTVETSIESLGAAIELALAKHRKVLVRILPGNHNPTLYLAILFALAERYRNEPRVEVQKVPGEFWVHEFGKCMLMAHHGDKAKPDRLVHFVADEFAPIWGRTKHRFLWTGHLHHTKAEDIGGVQWEQLRAVTARDAYAYSHAYVARAQLQAITLHRELGEMSRVKVNQ